MNRDVRRKVRALGSACLASLCAAFAPLASAQTSPPPTSQPSTDPDNSPAGAPKSKLTPEQVKLLRNGVPLPPSLPAGVGPKPLSPGGGPGDPDSLRGWEIWWELNRDRLVPNPARDLSLVVAHVPPDPRTRVQVDGERVGSYERIEPSLRLILTYEPSDLVRARALISLAKLGEDPRDRGSRKTYATILPYVEHADAQLAEAAITALGILGTEDALFPLAQLIEGKDFAPESAQRDRRAGVPVRANDRRRALAFYALGLIGRDSAREDVRRLAASRICSLFASESNASSEVRFAALHALSLVPVADVPEAPPPTPQEEVWSQRRAARAAALAKATPQPAASRAGEIAWALAVLEDEREAGWIRAQAVTAAARLCADLPGDSPQRARVVERLLKALAPRSHDTVEVEQCAALALGELGDADGDELDARVRACLGAALTEASDRATQEF